MSLKQDWEQLFKDDTFVNNYKIGEKLTGQFAQALINQSGLVADSMINPDKLLLVLDNACGTGVVSSILNQQLHDMAKSNWRLTCGDISEGMLEYTRRRMERENWQNAEVKTLDAQALQLPSARFTHVVTSFAYMALPKSLVALDETCRILQSGGTVAFSTWIEPGWISVVQRAIMTLPDSLPFPTTEEFLSSLCDGKWNSISWIESQLRQRGFVNIEVNADTKAMSVPVPDLVEMTMMMLPMITRSFWTDKQREESEHKVRPALEKYLRNLYGEKGDVPMEWTAILSMARKPL